MRSQNILFVLALISLSICLSQCLPRWLSQGGYCQSSDDCPETHCCAIGFVRYSFPQCVPMGRPGDWCRAYNEPQNRSLAFPDGQSYEFHGVYTQFCPCGQHLVCERAKCTTPSAHMNSVDSVFDYFY